MSPQKLCSYLNPSSFLQGSGDRWLGMPQGLVPILFCSGKTLARFMPSHPLEPEFLTFSKDLNAFFYECMVKIWLGFNIAL